MDAREEVEKMGIEGSQAMLMQLQDQGQAEHYGGGDTNTPAQPTPQSRLASPASPAAHRAFSLPRPAMNVVNFLTRRPSAQALALQQQQHEQQQLLQYQQQQQQQQQQQDFNSYESLTDELHAFHSSSIPHSHQPPNPMAPPQMLRVASQKMGNAVDKVFTSFNRSLSLLSMRSSFGNLMTGSAGASSVSLSGPPDVNFSHVVLTDFDYWRSETPMTPAKIQFRIHQIEVKLKIEEKVKSGTERMCQVLMSAPQQVDEKRLKMAEDKLVECREKCGILVQSLSKYKLLVVEEKELPPLPTGAEEGENDDDEAENIPFPDGPPTAFPAGSPSRTGAATGGGGRPLLSGRMKVTLVGCSGLPIKGTTHRPETYAILRIDSNEKAKTRNSRSKWMDPFDIQVEKGGDVEIAVYEKGTGSIVAFVWFPLVELDSMLKISKERRTRELVQRSDSFKSGQLDSTDTTGVKVDAPPSSPQFKSSVLYDGENVWLDLEPAGQLSVKINFSPETERVKKNIDGLLRSKPVTKVIQKKGHKFTPQKFYPVMKCAVCTEFLTSAQGYQCSACKYTCHKKCQPRVPIKCITLTASEQESEYDDESHTRHRIPHRFEETLNLGVTWCAHCGYMLPLNKKDCRKCGECGISAHTNCALLVPNICGLTPVMIEQMRLAIEHAENAKRDKELMAAERARAAALEEQRLKLEEAAIAAARAKAADSNQYLATTGAKNSSASGSAGFLNGTTTHTPQSPYHHHYYYHSAATAATAKRNFGKVMLAEEKVTGKHYAIKVLKKDFIIESDEVESTRSEKRVFLTANLERFPFLKSRLYFVMEYVSGGDLMWHIQQRHFTEARAKYYACEVLLALEYFHKNNVIYRDLKLDNILLTLDGHIKIADYGLCKENMPYGATTMTFCGTPEFMSPEILLEKPYTRTVDWWSFGVLIYELLLGQAPFKGDSEDEIFNSILHKDPSFPTSKIDPNCNGYHSKAVRLGAGPLDADEIKSHPYFGDVNWDDVLHRRVPPPFVPAITSATDVSNFDEEFTKEMPVLTPCKTVLAAADQEEFRGFTYMSEWAQAARANTAAAAAAGKKPDAAIPSTQVYR
ncbi:hypothetical protein BDR26DRAFT_852855 [Obelidium mucronatum]|nr:hypothetical protein BDR26DRAFT_852855 [Obelidium mucronatum]